MRLALLIIGLLILGAGLAMIRVMRLTRRYASTIRRSNIAAASGLVEISGVARALEGAPHEDPDGVACIWHRVVMIHDDGTFQDDPGHAMDRQADAILLDDGTGRCAMTIEKPPGFMTREMLKSAGKKRRGVLRIREGTRLHAIGRVEKLTSPSRGATHRIEWDRAPPSGFSDPSLEEMADFTPRMKAFAVGASILGAVLVATGLWLVFGSTS